MVPQLPTRVLLAPISKAVLAGWIVNSQELDVILLREMLMRKQEEIGEAGESPDCDGV